MASPESRFLTCRDRNIHFMEWGDSARDTVVIWHGVTGTCNDHRELAARLSEDYHVICPDSLCCGLSDWAKNGSDTSLSFYADIAEDLFRQLGKTSLRWIGSSKGGGLGIVLAGRDNGLTIGHLVLNDVGVGLDEKFRLALAKSLASPPIFEKYQDFDSKVRNFLTRMGLELSPQKWHELIHSWSRRTDNGSFTYHYDPRLAVQFAEHPEDFDLWNYYDLVTAKTLLVRGSHSIVPDEEARMMAERGPCCSLLDRPGGHVSLMDKVEEQDVILEFLKN
ncbi:alpha/beta hydrolase [Emcibacter sp.]|uniref:alpha/beta fold hydrolase n=1 Tax=Emcibacter sp. TaxID=1979954 RepID=UPI002AA76479|nr:alpha/beta hydrolase [Emcibacter sp.]